MKPAGASLALALAVAVAVACGPGTGPPTRGLTPPINECPQNPCTAFPLSGGVTPACNGGACLVTSAFPNLIFVISLSTDSYFAPGETFAIEYADLFPVVGSATCSAAGAVPCTNLPNTGIVEGAYVVSPQEQSPSALDWNLGNPSATTALPVHVTYRPLWPPDGSTANGIDVNSLDQPLGAVVATVVADSSLGGVVGPGQSTPTGYQAILPHGVYEVTVQPDPPFDVAFPPHVKQYTVATGSQVDSDQLLYDTTTEETGGSTGRQIPTFAVSRTADVLTGWTAYLRDQTTLRRISSLVTLTATTTTVRLPTNHEPVGVDALTNAELVMAPPAGQPIPTYKVAPLGGQLPETEVYPALAEPAKVGGTVADVEDGSPVEADLLFEAQAIYLSSGSLNDANFEYVGRASARINPTTGESSYSATLPPGQYRLTLEPLDSGHQLTVEPNFTIDPKTGAPAGPLLVAAPRPVQGSAIVADGRPMAGAFVEAVPTGCYNDPSPLCLPRDAQTVTDGQGAFQLSLDPGSYVLRVEPPYGTRFSWVTKTVLVGPTPVTVSPILVPAPAHAALQLLDPVGNPVVNAVVRVFEEPTAGPIVEVGRAITDATGTYDMYLAPSAP